MARRAIASLVVLGLASVALAVTLSLPTDLAAASKSATPAKKPILNPKFDPTAEQVDLFEAVDAKHVTVKLVPKDAMGGTVLIENKTDKPLTVKIPDAVVGVSIHAQFNNNPLGNGLNLFGQGIGQNNLAGGQAAGQQMQGGGVGMNGQNGQFPGNGQGQNNGPNPFGNQFGPGNGFFSIPPESVISLHLTSVCLEHGKPEPDSTSKYTLVPVSRVSKDPVLHQLLAAVGSGKLDAQAAQAAAWHLTDNLSFDELAAKMNVPLGGLGAAPYFSREQIQTAKELISQATERAEKEKSAGASADKADAPAKVTKSARLTSN